MSNYSVDDCVAAAAAYATKSLLLEALDNLSSSFSFPRLRFRMDRGNKRVDISAPGVLIDRIKDKAGRKHAVVLLPEGLFLFRVDSGFFRSAVPLCGTEREADEETYFYYGKVALQMLMRNITRSGAKLPDKI